MNNRFAELGQYISRATDLPTEAVWMLADNPPVTCYMCMWINTHQALLQLFPMLQLYSWSPAGKPLIS